MFECSRIEIWMDDDAMRLSQWSTRSMIERIVTYMNLGGIRTGLSDDMGRCQHSVAADEDAAANVLSRHAMLDGHLVWEFTQGHIAPAIYSDIGRACNDEQKNIF